MKGLVLWTVTQFVFLISMIFFKLYTIYAFLIFLFKDNYETYFSIGESILYFILSIVLLIIVKVNVKFFVR